MFSCSLSALSADGDCNKPTASFSVGKAVFCEGDGKGNVDLTLSEGSISDYIIKWWKGADTIYGTPLGAISSDFIENLKAEDSGILTYQLIDSVTGCAGDIHNFDVLVNPTPEAPKVRYAVRYDRREGAASKEFIDIIVKSPGVVEEMEDQVLFWSKEENGIYQKGSSEASKPYYDPEAKDGVTEKQERWVKWALTTPVGVTCMSAPSKVDILISSAKLPTVTDLHFCVGEKFDVKAGVTAATGYELLWFNSPNDTEFDAMKNPPAGVVDPNEPGSYTFYVALRGLQSPYALSEIIPYNVTVHGNVPPTGTMKVNYSKSDGPEFKTLLEQSPEAVIAGDSCELKWYDVNKMPVDLELLTPVYDASLVGNVATTCYVSQVNRLSGCESEMVPVSIFVGSIPVPIVTNLSVCENSEKLTKPLSSKIVIAPTPGTDASDYELVWYRSDSLGQIDMSQEYSDILLTDEEMKIGANDKKKDLKFYVRERCLMGGESPVVPFYVTIYSRPRITLVDTKPKCKGEAQDLSEMFVLDLVNSEVKFTVASGAALASSVVTESGVYGVQASYGINLGSIDEEYCSSEIEQLKVSFHSLDVEIEGSSVTCPGTDIDLTAVVNVEGGLSESDLAYSWSTNLNSVVGNSKTFNTTGEGLDKAGDLMKVTLEVSSVACQGSFSVKRVHVITVGNGPVVGSFSWFEQNNQSVNAGRKIAMTEAIKINACGDDVTVDFSDVDMTGDKVEWFTNPECSGSAVKTGSVVVFPKSEYGKYYVRYENNCYAYVTVEIVDAAVEIKSLSGGAVIACEGDAYVKELEVSCLAGTPVREWYRNGEMILNEKDALSFPSMMFENSGKYSVEYRYDGCVSYMDVVDLHVKPYIKVDVFGYDLVNGKRVFLVEPGQNAEVVFAFMDPTSPAEIASLTAVVKDVATTNNGTLSADNTKFSISKVEESHHINLTFESEDYCPGTIDFIVRNDNDGLFNIVSDNLDVYPNPVSDKLIVPGMEDGDECVIYDLTGKAVLRAESSPINIYELPTGVYVVDVDGRKARVVKK